MSQRRVDTPVAPPAFPSIPLGMAVKTGDQITFRELEDELGSDAARKLVAQTEPSPHPEAVAELPPPPAPRSSTMPILVGAVAAMTLLGLLVGLLLMGFAILAVAVSM